MRCGRRAVVVGVLALVAACGDGSSARYAIAGVTADVAHAAARVTGQSAPMADAVTATGHAGFDTGEYPGDDAMRAWRTGGSPYEWTGYYLPSPCHPDEGWSGKRQTLNAMGYGLAVLYVGQQTWGRKPGAPHYLPVKVTRAVKVHVGHGSKRHVETRYVTRTVMRRAPRPKPTETCNADFVTALRGAQDGLDAANRAEHEGFPHGTVIFLDLERMDVVHQRMRDYYMNWTRIILTDGRYRPGIYVHTYNADLVHNDIRTVHQIAGDNTDPPFWIAKSAGFELTKLPHEVGHTFAAVWQGVLNVEQTFNGKTIKLDVNVSRSHDPSAGSRALTEGR